ncbi:heterokaryon incompatibility protein [Lentithecium fluviatile CBS 122367]|uniref:Heterokaryon incompatibility protein n=1 Tax=Lentithecium fluviatile CBS 122367 TaxID=1168545 RepID=A0A6G1IMQ6_9PLEO|nr:heterokaryon incompatibility protein [Lentithecium fluviatile CBS 122367]
MLAGVFFWNIGPDKQTATHHQTCGTFKRSVDLGCYVCNRLWVALTLDERCVVSSLVESESNFSSDATEVSTYGARTNSVQNCVTVASFTEGGLYGHPGCYLLQLAFNASAVLPPEMVPGRKYWRASFLLQQLNGPPPSNITERLPESTKSAETLFIARSWIEECAAKHQRCNAFTGEQGWCPTRLLDCGPFKNSEPCCRLIETDSISLNGPYMTLSHCWGRTDCLKLTTDNYAKLLHTIPLPLLPQYLWIDSLCIIQRGDELADWLREVKVMGQVYLNSFCNISAANAQDGNHTLFSSRNPDTLYPQTVDLTVDGHASLYLVSDFRFWETEVSRAPINARGWVLQERLLSPRVLHFGERQILWECREKDAAEIYPEGLPHKISRSAARFKDLAPDHHIANNNTGSNFAAYRSWVQIVRAYTACELSFPGDKLVALSAIAKAMRDILRDEYVVGMWRRYLEFELLWSVSGNRTGSASRPDTYRSPSWSWAAVDGEVNPSLPDVETADLLIEVVSLELEYSTDDNTNLVQGGWLRLRGALKQLMLVRHRSSNTCSYEDWDMFVNGEHVSVPTESSYGEPQPHVKLDALHDHFEEQNARDALYCMPARVRAGDNGSIYILILEVDDLKRGVYRRIGLARGWGKEVKEKFLARSVRGDRFPCEEYRDGLHLIRII